MKEAAAARRESEAPCRTCGGRVEEEESKKEKKNKGGRRKGGASPSRDYLLFFHFR